MPCPHNEISIVQRSQQQSAVAAAAYQSGEKLFCEYDQKVKHYPEKRGIVHNEILLPANAPRSYADRNTLWNAAEAVEKQWNSQLARRWVLTIPREIPPDLYAVLVREFCEQQFVSKGMIVDFAIHDPHPPGHNPHAHVLLTMRAMDEHGKWLPKSRKVYDLDENGERIKLPSGRWKSHKEDTVDWNDQKYCEIWRHEWEVIQNRYLEANDRPERVDLRSYARQGLDIVPTVHEGAAVRQMEKRGIQTNIGNLNREIRAANSLMQSMSDLYQMVLDNMTNAEILATNQDYILQIDKLDKIRTTILTERFKETVRLELEVIYISGATGTGKTRGVLEGNGYSNVYRVTDYLHPFDGYTCQPVICFDEFRSSLKLKEMLLYCDIYPIELPSRYANKFACYNKVYIVSNWSLEKQYPEIQREDEESWNAFLRRIHKVIIYDKSGNRTEYNSVKEYLDRNDGFIEYTGEDLPFD